MRRKLFIAGLMTAVLCGPQTARAATLEVELSRLLTQHPDIEAARKTLQSNVEGIGIAKSALLPQLSLSSTAAREFVDSPGTRSAGDKSILNKDVNSLTLTQTLFDGRKTESQIRSAELNRKLAAVSLEGTRQNTLFQGIQNYINVLRQMRLLAISRESERRIQRQLNLEDERVRRGSGIAVDVLQAKSRLQVAKEKRVTLEGHLQDALSRYEKIFGFPANIEDMYDPRPPIDGVPSQLNRAVAIALTENPAIRQAGTNIDLARERQNTVRAQYYPTVDLDAEYNFEQNESAVVGTRRDYMVGFKASWDLFTGFSTSASAAQASYDTEARRAKLDSTARDIEQQVRLAWQALLTARERVTLLENAVNIASEVAVSRRKLRAAGKETVINVLDAENEVNNAQSNFTTASYDQTLAVYQLLLALGRLTPLTLNLVLD